MPLARPSRTARIALLAAALLALPAAGLLTAQTEPRMPTTQPAPDAMPTTQPMTGETAAPTPPAATDNNRRTTDSGLTIVTVSTPADPVKAKPGDLVWVHYTGKLQDGSVFDSSLKRGPDQPFPFPLGAGRVIKGWDEGIVGMRVGEKRQLIIPPDLAYGPTARPGIPANSTLIFDVELVGVYSPSPQ